MSDRSPIAARPRRVVGAVARRPGLVLSAVVLLLVMGWILVPDWFGGQSPTAGVVRQRLEPPSSRHLFGTDQLGRDVYARVVHAAGLSLGTALAATAIASAAGVLLGLAAGYFGRTADVVISRIVDITLSIPSVLLSLLIISAMGSGTLHIAVAVAVTSIAGFARLARAEVLRIRTAVHVEAAALCGARWWRILARYVAPAVAGPVLGLAALDFGLVVLAVSALSFLGYGPPPPAQEWGALVASGRNYLATAWWLSTLPGLTVAVVVLAANRLSRALETERSHT
nr:ABC transporter permease [Dactylosporangium thailandense]